jgi:hypothetical protein
MATPMGQVDTIIRQVHCGRFGAVRRQRNHGAGQDNSTPL